MPLPDPAQSRAVLIGVHSYTDLDPLPSVRNNLIALRALLTDDRVWGLPDEHCVVLENPASTDEVLDAVHSAARDAEAAFLLYFAGHGLLSPDAELRLALSRSESERLYRSVAYQDLRHELLHTCTAPSQVVILDCCYSGRALDAHMGSLEDGGDVPAGVDGTYVMTASAALKPAWAPPGERFTAFTGELVEVIREGVAGAADPLDMRTVFRAVRGRLAARGRTLPQQFARNDGHAIALVRNRAGTDLLPLPPSLPPPPPRPGQRPGPRPGQRRGRALAGALLALALPFTLVGDAGAGPGGPSPSAGGPPSAETGRSRFGDHRTADPCALVDARVLARFGAARIDRDYGNFDRCDVLVDTGDGDPVDVVVDLDTTGRPDGWDPTRRVGTVGVLAEPPEAQACMRRLLVDGEREVTVRIVAKRSERTPQACAMADAAADHAARVLHRGPIARRTLPRGSIGREDACGLLSARALEVVPGVDTKPSDPGFGHFECEWESTTRHMWVELRYDRGQPPSAGEIGGNGSATRIGGRSTVIWPGAEGEDTCLVRTVHRRYAAQDARAAAETVNLTVGGDRPEAELCRTATALSTSVVNRLNATRPGRT
ncbi:caspase family protein [Streptomyces sp. NPDC000594]|uniref:caspase family protein n=1 Tax=Streptomyces sp. NPDC000594 TaxID=3154261 RepID=UPI00331FCBFE